MPLYEYRCRGCGKQFEVLQRVDDRPLRKCERCAGKLEKLVSVSSFQLKGGGWYSDGYGSAGKSGAGSSKAGSAPGSKSKDSSTKKPESGKASKD